MRIADFTLGAVSSVLLAASCANESDQPAHTTRPHVVEWRLEDRPSLHLGTAASPVTFGWVTGGLVLSNGTLVIADNMNKTLHYFGADGTHVGSVGRSGEGPGEFEAVSSIASWADTVVVGDLLQQRVTLFSPQGEYVRSFTPSPIWSSEMMTFGVTGGRLIIFGGAHLGRQEGLSRDTMMLASASMETGATTVIDAVLGEEYVYTTTPTGMRMRRAPFSRKTLIATLPSRYAVGFSDSDSIVVRDDRHETIFAIHGTVEERPVGADDIRRYYTATRDPGSDIDAYLRRSGNPEAGPPSMPAFDKILFDESGHLWVQRYAPPWEDGPVTWDVYDEAGRAVAKLESTIAAEPLHIGEDHVLLALTDSLEVQTVALYSLVKAAR